MKTCTKCKVEKQLTSFKPRKSSKDGLHTWCSDCLSAYYADHNVRNRQKKQEYKKVNYENNKEEIKSKRRAYYVEHKEEICERKKDYRLSNLASISARNAEWRKNNSESLKEKKAAWQRNNKGLVCATRARRRLNEKRATPEWANLDEIKRVYKEAEKMREAGNDVHVDHIIPIRSDVVCGLHVHWNLQIIEARKNRAKGNRLP